MKTQFSVRSKAGKIMANAVVGMSEFRTDHGIPVRELSGIPINKDILVFLRNDPWEIPTPVFCQSSEEIVIANGVQ